MNSAKMLTKILIVCACLACVCASGIYHENTRILYKPDVKADYFGYSVILNPHGLIVGAPKYQSKMKSGQVFNCSLSSLESNTKSCSILSRKSSSHSRKLPEVFFKDDMWNGASIASLTNDKILICAPRSTEPMPSHTNIYAHGACYIWSQQRDVTLQTLPDKKLQGFFLKNVTRQEYKIILEFGNGLSFFAYGQAGMSVKIIANDTFIVGAPGLLQWTGGILRYYYDYDTVSPSFKRDIVTNTYFTEDLGPDEYFGYSVESGVFQPRGETLFVGGAPRSKKGYGQVLIFTQRLKKPQEEPMDVIAKVSGPQLGAYFGASLCCIDIDGDGVSDLLVGAPNYVKKDGSLPFDQGAVFVYMTKQTDKSFILEQSGEVIGSGASGARFGTAISGLGDIDGDGFNDVAIAAPWENDGSGVVYIYRGTSKGLKSQYVQKLVAEGVSSFGISLSNGMDVDHNHCNDLAIGAAKNSSVYLYRCVPSVNIFTSIEAPNVVNLPPNATSNQFSAFFCTTVDKQLLWPRVKIDFKARILIDPVGKRGYISGEAEYRITVTPGFQECTEIFVNIKPIADLSKPIPIYFNLEPDELLKEDSKVFNTEAARVSEDSVLHSSFLVQMTRDCGDNKFCTPWLVMTLQSFNDPYIPGASGILGANLTILNIATEPAYGTKVNITLPTAPIRLPSLCSLQNLVMTCEIPAPLHMNRKVSYDIDLEYKYSEETELKIVAKLYDGFNRNITDEATKELTIKVTPEAVFNVIGKSLPNDTVAVSRTVMSYLGFSKVYEAEYVPFIHHVEITNFGPSDWISLGVHVTLPEVVILSSQIKGCDLNSTTAVLLCNWYIPAKDTRSVDLAVQLDLSRFGDILLEKTVLNVTTQITLDVPNGNTTAKITTTIMLRAAPIWPLIAGVLAGLNVLAAIIYLFHRFGFFSRPKREGFKKLQEQTSAQPGTSAKVSDTPEESIPLNDVNSDSD